MIVLVGQAAKNDAVVKAQLGQQRLDNRFSDNRASDSQRNGWPRPSLLLLKLLCFWLSIGVVHAVLAQVPIDLFQISLRHSLLLIWWWVGAFIVILAIVDTLWTRYRTFNISIDRQLPTRIVVGEWHTVFLKIHYDRQDVIEVIVSDFYPTTVDVKGLPCSVELEPGCITKIQYQLRPTRRGELMLPRIQVLSYSRMGLWLNVFWLEKRDSVRVYPNYLSSNNSSIASMVEQRHSVGARRVRSLGQGMEFRQLRQYQAGDSLRQIDWKATSRYRRIISKEYQSERDNTVLFLLDAGRRMGALDGDLSLLDHAMQALLLVSHIALKQGDSVGLLTVGDEERWLPPGKSSTQVNRMLNMLYDLEPAINTSDYVAAVKSALAKQPRRSLVIMLSHLRDDNLDEILPAIKHLQQHHVVLLANLQETSLTDYLNHSIEDYDDAIRFAGALQYFQQCRKVKEQLSYHNILSINCTPLQLPMRLMALYQEIKHRGRL